MNYYGNNTYYNTDISHFGILGMKWGHHSIKSFIAKKQNDKVDKGFKKWKENDVVSGAIVLLFDHHKGDIGVKMNEIQHQFYKEILSAQHFHLDHDNCLEIIAVKGNAYRLTDLANQLIGLKGIIHGNLVTSKMI